MLDWREVDLEGVTPTGLSASAPFGRGVVVRGSRDGGGRVAHVTSDGGVAWLHRGTDAVWSTGFAEEICWTHGSPPVVGPWSDACPAGDVEPAVRSWVACGDEDLCLVTVDARGRVWAHEPDAEDPVPGPWLASADGAARLRVAGAEHGVLVAGPLAEGEGLPESPQLWEYVGEEWRRVAMEPEPEAFTAAYEAPEPVFAGHRDGRPVVVGREGHELPVPQLDLDPDHPVVDVAHVRGTGRQSAGTARPGRLVLAVQVAEGPQLWVQHDRGWTMLPGPEGRLVAARLGHRERDRAWCVVDGHLWTADLGNPWDAPGA